jgi:WD40 repeat protein
LRGGEGHLGSVGGVAFAPDGKTLATASGAGLGGDHPVILWETATGKELGRLQHPAGRQPSVLAFSPDGKTLAVLTNSGAIDFWDRSTRKLREGGISGRPAGAFVYAAGGEAIATVAGSVDLTERTGRPVPGTVDAKWWDVATGKELHHVRGEGFRGVSSFELSADGRTLIVRSSKDQKFHLWDIPTAKERAAFDPPRGSLYFAFSPDARILAWRDGTEATVHVLETAVGKEELAQLRIARQVQPSREAMQTMRMLFAPDGQTFAAAWDRTIGLWDATTGQELGRFQADQGPIAALAFSSDGQLLASGGSDSTALVWRVMHRGK